MKVYAEFYYERTDKYEPKTHTFEQCEPYMHPHLGSDAVLILDGRNSLQTMLADVRTRIERLAKVKKIDGFKIIRAQKFTDKGREFYCSF